MQDADVRYDATGDHLLANETLHEEDGQQGLGVAPLVDALALLLLAIALTLATSVLYAAGLLKEENPPPKFPCRRL